MGPFMKSLQYRELGGSIAPDLQPVLKPREEVVPVALSVDTRIPFGGNADASIQEYFKGKSAPLTNSYQQNKTDDAIALSIAEANALRRLKEAGVPNAEAKVQAVIKEYRGDENYGGGHSGPQPGQSGMHSGSFSGGTTSANPADLGYATPAGYAAEEQAQNQTGLKGTLGAVGKVPGIIGGLANMVNQEIASNVPAATSQSTMTNPAQQTSINHSGGGSGGYQGPSHGGNPASGGHGSGQGSATGSNNPADFGYNRGGPIYRFGGGATPTGQATGAIQSYLGGAPAAQPAPMAGGYGSPTLSYGQGGTNYSDQAMMDKLAMTKQNRLMNERLDAMQAQLNQPSPWEQHRAQQSYIDNRFGDGDGGGYNAGGEIDDDPWGTPGIAKSVVGDEPVQGGNPHAATASASQAGAAQAAQANSQPGFATQIAMKGANSAVNKVLPQALGGQGAGFSSLGLANPLTAAQAAGGAGGAMSGAGLAAGAGAALPWLGLGFGAGKLFGLFNDGGKIGGPLAGHRMAGGKWMPGEEHAIYRNEGGPMINPANKGKFTAKAKAAGEGTQEYARKVLAAPEGRYDPATRKQANFARNAAAWHKNDGGMIGPLSKTVHKTADGEAYEMNFHNPLSQKEKKENKGGE